MTDIIPQPRPARRAGRPAPPERRAESDAAAADAARHLGMVELLFFAYRDFTGEADHVLAAFGFGRAHHRVLHFVRRNPGLSVAELLDILRITKQSLNRVLKHLRDEGYIEQRTGRADGRVRELHVSDKGADLADRLMSMQQARVAAALAPLGAKGVDGAEAFLRAMISPEHRGLVGRPPQVPGREPSDEDTSRETP
jgi:DNA-binding MarR family transcriptional regulator